MHEKTIFHWDDPLRLELQLTDATVQGWERLRRLDRDLLTLKASPGGSADLLAATPGAVALRLEQAVERSQS